MASLFGDFNSLTQRPYQADMNWLPQPWNPAGGHTREQILGLPGSAAGLRNRALLSVLEQYNGPGLAGVNAAGGVDTAARNMDSMRQKAMSSMYSRGLQGSGAMDLTNRALWKGYGNDVMSAEYGAQQGEVARKQALLQAMQGIISGDIKFRDTVNSGVLGAQQAKAAEDALSFNKLLSTIGSGVGLLATLGGGAMGAMGVGGLTSMGQGALIGNAIGTGNFGALGTILNNPQQYSSTPINVSKAGFGGLGPDNYVVDPTVRQLLGMERMY